MNTDELRAQARHNRAVFEDALGPYVALKLEGVTRQLDQGAKSVWFDASGCVWCLFDAEAFARAGNEATALKGRDVTDFDLQLYWSLGDVVMPKECDPAWVAKRIAEEAMRQLRERGLRCAGASRVVDGERHLGVVCAKTRLRLFAVGV